MSNYDKAEHQVKFFLIIKNKYFKKLYKFYLADTRTHMLRIGVVLKRNNQIWNFIFLENFQIKKSKWRYKNDLQIEL